MSAILSSSEALQLSEGGQYPRCHKEDKYLELYQTVVDAIRKDNARHGIKKKLNELPNYNATIVKAKAVTKQFLQQGHVHDAPSNWVGRQVDKHMDTLQEMYGIILDGYHPTADEDSDWSKAIKPTLLEELDGDLLGDSDSEDVEDEDLEEEEVLPHSESGSVHGSEGGEEEMDEQASEGSTACFSDELAALHDEETILPYRNVEQVYRKSARFKHLVDNVLKLHTMRGVFNMLRQACPGLQKMLLVAKKPRDHPEAQVCCQTQLRSARTLHSDVLSTFRCRGGNQTTPSSPF